MGIPFCVRGGGVAGSSPIHDQLRVLPASERFLRHRPSLLRERDCCPPPSSGTCGMRPARLSAMSMVLSCRMGERHCCDSNRGYRPPYNTNTRSPTCLDQPLATQKAHSPSSPAAPLLTSLFAAIGRKCGIPLRENVESSGAHPTKAQVKPK